MSPLPSSPSGASVSSLSVPQPGGPHLTEQPTGAVAPDNRTPQHYSAPPSEAMSVGSPHTLSSFILPTFRRPSVLFHFILFPRDLFLYVELQLERLPKTVCRLILPSLASPCYYRIAHSPPPLPVYTQVVALLSGHFGEGSPSQAGP